MIDLFKILLSSERQRVHFQTVLLSGIAGFCDTATFVAADSIFSAHVTGNFIVFGSQVVVGDDSRAWIKLLTFPVFVIAVMTGGWLVANVKSRSAILLAESTLLLICGLVSLLPKAVVVSDYCAYGRVMLVVLAMGLQNAFGKLCAKETHGPTTMMTGNVTQAALDLGSLIRLGGAAEPMASLKKNLITVGSFLVGCLAGAWAGHVLGLGSVFFPGLALVLSCFILKQNSLHGQ